MSWWNSGEETLTCPYCRGQMDLRCEDLEGMHAIDCMHCGELCVIENDSFGEDDILVHRLRKSAA